MVTVGVKDGVGVFVAVRVAEAVKVNDGNPGDTDLVLVTDGGGVKVLVDVDGSVRITVPVWVFVRSKVGEIVDVVNAAGEREGSGETVWDSVGKRKGIWVSVSVDAGHGDGGMLGICVFLFNDGKFVGVLDDRSGTEVAAAMYVYLPKGSTQDDKDMLITARRKHLNFINFNSSKYSSKQVELIGHPLFTEMQASIIDVCKGRIPNAKIHST